MLAALWAAGLVLSGGVLRAQDPVRDGEGDASGGDSVSFDAKACCALKAPVTIDRDGTIVAIAAREGEQVKQGDKLVRFRLDEEEVLNLREAAAPTSIRRLAIQLDELREQELVLSRSLAQEEKLAKQDLAPNQALEIKRIDLALAKRRVDLLDQRYRIEQDQAAAAKERIEKWLGEPLSPDHIPEEVDLQAPMDGTVIWVNPELEPEMVVTGRKTAFVVGRMDPIAVRGVIHEMEWHKVRVGDKAQVTVASLPGRTFSGTVRRLAWTPTSMDPERPTYYEIALDVPNPDLAIKEGFKCRVQIKPSK